MIRFSPNFFSHILDPDCLNLSLRQLDLTGSDVQLSTVRQLLTFFPSLEKLCISVPPAGDTLEQDFAYLDLGCEYGVE